MKIGKAIKAQRKAIGASAAWLALRLFVHRNTIDNWEHDKTEPTTSQLIEIARALGCTIEDLLNSKAQPKRIHTSL